MSIGTSADVTGAVRDLDTADISAPTIGISCGSQKHLDPTSSPAAISRRATTSIVGTLEGESMYLAAALGRHEWLKNLLARGYKPCPNVDKWLCMTKLLFAKRELTSPTAELEMRGDENAIGGVVDSTCPGSSDMMLERSSLKVADPSS
jgi:hypothetical protein